MIDSAICMVSLSLLYLFYFNFLFAIGSESNGFVHRGTVPEPGGTLSVVGCSCIVTDLGSHRAQMNIDVCVDINFL